jgi:hypothetical protein
MTADKIQKLWNLPCKVGTGIAIWFSDLLQDGRYGVSISVVTEDFVL